MGESIGLNLSAAIKSATEPDPDDPSKKISFDKAYAESRMNLSDPMWQLKAAKLKGSILEQMAQTGSQWASTEEKNKETAAWLEDRASLSPWISADRETRKSMATPVVHSKMGIDTMQKTRLSDDIRDMQEKGFSNKLEQERLKGEHSAEITRRIDDWNDAIAGADHDTFAAISALKGGGRLPNGLPTPESIMLLNAYRRARGMTDYGTKSSEYLEKPGVLTPENKVRLQDLEADARDIRKQMAAARVAAKDDPSASGKVDELEAQLQEVENMRREVAGGKDISSGTGRQSASAEPYARERSAIQDRIIDAKARNDSKAEKKATDELAIVDRKTALKIGAPIISKSMKPEDIRKKIETIPLPGRLLIDHLGKWKTIEDEDDRKAILGQLEKKASSDEPAKDEAMPVIPGINPPRESSSAQEAARSRAAGREYKSKADATQARKSQIEELKSALKKANTGKGTFMSPEDYKSKYLELAKLLEADKSQ